MSTDLVLHSTEEAFSLAERISASNLVPSAYRGKPVETAIAMMYGAEMGMPPMSSLQRIVVINGKPSMDAQGMVAMIRQAGHSISGDVSAEGAKITGKRGDNGDTMTVEWGPAEAQRAGLSSATYNKFPADMYWARAVSQLGRRLFADVLLGVSYVPEEAAAIPTNGNGHGVDSVPPPPPAVGERTVRQPPGAPKPEADANGEIIDGDVEDAEIVPDPDAPKAETRQLNKIKRLLNSNFSIQEEGAVCTKVGEVVGRDVTALADLTSDEADKAITALDA
jgi:hypothetical protein